MNHFNYFSDIEAAFIRRRGRNLLLSPLDWALIESWREREIPLRIVLRAIDTVFDKFDDDSRTRRAVKSLAYCREEVEAQHVEWLESQVGGKVAEESRNQGAGIEEKTSGSSNSFFSEAAMTAHLEKISAELTGAIKSASGELLAVLEIAAERLAGSGRDLADAAQLETFLQNLDAMIDQVLVESLATEELKGKILGQMSAYRGKMDEPVFKRTFEFMLSKNLRERHHIPRLTLFDL